MSNKYSKFRITPLAEALIAYVDQRRNRGIRRAEFAEIFGRAEYRDLILAEGCTSAHSTLARELGIPNHAD